MLRFACEKGMVRGSRSRTTALSRRTLLVVEKHHRQTLLVEEKHHRTLKRLVLYLDETGENPDVCWFNGDKGGHRDGDKVTE
ncbi:hypothetical protein V6N13_128865 [Hibiscus sabdariffa]